jgi:MGT family glycosyltransferase
VLKVFVIGLPSVSVQHMLKPLLAAIVNDGLSVTYYNTAEFLNDQAGIVLRPYPAYQGYDTATIDTQTSFFKFAQILAETSDVLVDFLCGEIERERPDLVLHSHLALWGKLAATAMKIPAVSLCTTFVLDERFMVPFLRDLKKGASFQFDFVRPAFAFARQVNSIQRKYGISDKINIWDAYVNHQPMNLVFIPEAFQPHRALFADDYSFVGFPMRLTHGHKKKVIYISMGTVFNKDAGLITACIHVLASFAGYTVIASVGRNSALLKGSWPSHVVVGDSINQIDVLNDAALFVTHGGMASTMEAACTGTPMLVIPQIPEQMLTAKTVARLGIGRQIQMTDFTVQLLHNTVVSMLGSMALYHNAYAALHEHIDSLDPIGTAVTRIREYAQVGMVSR